MTCFRHLLMEAPYLMQAKSNNSTAALGFSVTEDMDDSGFGVLDYPGSLFSKPLRVYVLECDSGVKKSVKVDAPGNIVLGLLSRDLEKDRSNLSDNGAQELYTPFELEINKRKLKVCFMRGPSHEMLELIQPVG